MALLDDITIVSTRTTENYLSTHMKIKMIIALIAILWVGMILAIGMESIVKFNTPSLSKAVAFDVGRTVFSAFNKVQCLLLLILIVGMMIGPFSTVDRVVVAVIAIVLALQALWLFPHLSQRVDIILAGNKPSPTYQHSLYGILELIKFSLLL